MNGFGFILHLSYQHAKQFLAEHNETDNDNLFLCDKIIKFDFRIDVLNRNCAAQYLFISMQGQSFHYTQLRILE